MRGLEPSPPLEILKWDVRANLPQVVLHPRQSGHLAKPVQAARLEQPFGFSDAMHRLSADIAVRCPDFGHIDVDRILFPVIRARNGRRHGLQARVTPLRFAGGAVRTCLRGRWYQVQRVVVGGQEILYLVGFCLPRFANRPFEEKIVTIFHELYHISPSFDGDIRRWPGRYHVHSSRQCDFDRRAQRLARQYLATRPDPGLLDFLHWNFAELCRRFGGVVGLRIPRPRLLPVPFNSHEQAPALRSPGTGECHASSDPDGG